MGGRANRPKLRDKDLVGMAVRLNRDVKTHGGQLHKAGWVYVVDGTWRGRFELIRISTATWEPVRRGGLIGFYVRGMKRADFHVLESQVPK